MILPIRLQCSAQVSEWCSGKSEMAQLLAVRKCHSHPLSSLENPGISPKMSTLSSVRTTGRESKHVGTRRSAKSDQEARHWGTLEQLELTA
jgi:hypothetical protein